LETDSQSQPSEIEILSLNDPGVPCIWVISFFLILMFIVAFWIFSGAKIAYFSIGEDELKRLKKNHKRLNQLEKIIRKKEELYFLLQAMNGMIRISLLVLVISLIYFSGFGVEQDKVELLVLLGLVFPFILLLVSERSKLQASQKPAMFIRYSFLVVQLLRPVYRLLFKPYTRLSAMLDRGNVHRKSLSISDLSEALDLDDQKDEEEKKILEGIVKFGQIEVKEVMKSRVDIVAVDYQIRFKKLLEVIIDSGYSRIPVVDQTLDQVRGILYIKDILPFLQEEDEFRWQELMRKPFFIPENKFLDDLLEEFRSEKNHMAVVVDEYGGTAGIITLEDILEEIVGEITDEMDQEEDSYSVLGEDHFLFEGKTSLNDFLKIIKEEDDYFDDFRGETESLAGLLLENYGMIPEKGTELTIRDYSFRIKSVDNRRIKQVEVYSKV
jgi:putative hemolysin